MALSIVAYLLLLAMTLALQLPPQSPSLGEQHEFVTISMGNQALARAQHQKYLTFLRFISGINNLNNDAGFIRRSLVLDYNNQFPQLQQAFSEIRIGIRAIKKSLLHNNLLVNVYQPTCPKPGTFNQTEIDRYLSYTIQKEKIALDILMRTPQLLYLVSSA